MYPSYSLQNSKSNYTNNLYLEKTSWQIVDMFFEILMRESQMGNVHLVIVEKIL